MTKEEYAKELKNIDESIQSLIKERKNLDNRFFKDKHGFGLGDVVSWGPEQFKVVEVNCRHICSVRMVRIFKDGQEDTKTFWVTGPEITDLITH